MSHTGIGPYIRQLRDKRGWTQAQLGDSVGVAAARIAQIEGGQTKLPGADIRRRLAGRESFEWMDGEDARLAAELAAIATEAATLPTPPDPERFQIVGEQLGSLGAVIRLADDATMREIIATVGHLVIGRDGGHIVYAPEFAPFFPHPTLVPVPRGKRLDVG